MWSAQALSLLFCLHIVIEADGLLGPLKNCGVSNVTGSADRIVGGIQALPGEFPWQVSLRKSNLLSPSSHLCGATLLNQWWIVTAAHCVYKRWKWFLSVAVGMYSQDDKIIYSYSVAKIIQHKQFDPDTFLNDIALIKVKKPINLRQSANGACMPHSGERTSGLVTATGWGRTYEGGYGSSVLMSVHLPIVPDDTCLDIYGEESYSTDAMMCAGYAEGGRDTCQGDSGGPLIQRKNGKAVLVGIVSSGVGCARPGLPGVYTRVSNYIEWIQSNTG